MTCKFDVLLSKVECPPLVFHNTIDAWPARKWSPDNLGSILGDKIFNCRVEPRRIQDHLWEADCIHLMATVSQVAAWMNGRPGGDNPLLRFSPAEFSCYVDYKYMKDMFSDHDTELKSVKWDTFGLDGRDGTDSTIWIGSAGASTCCHYDTYGFNLVAQIYGRKRWYLFPPSDTAYMYPVRIPYEESSVFCDVNMKCPDLSTHQLFKKCSPIVVTLDPGQVLFVPRHWWHYVQCVEPAISINTWVEVPEDNETRYQEALTRLLFSGLTSSVGDGGHWEDWLNPTEEILPMDVNLSYVEMSLQNLLNHPWEAKSKQQPPSMDDTHNTSLYKPQSPSMDDTHNTSLYKPQSPSMDDSHNTSLCKPQSPSMDDSHNTSLCKPWESVMDSSHDNNLTKLAARFKDYSAKLIQTKCSCYCFCDNPESNRNNSARCDNPESNRNKSARCDNPESNRNNSARCDNRESNRNNSARCDNPESNKNNSTRIDSPESNRNNSTSCILKTEKDQILFHKRIVDISLSTCSSHQKLEKDAETSLKRGKPEKNYGSGIDDLEVSYCTEHETSSSMDRRPIATRSTSEKIQTESLMRGKRKFEDSNGFHGSNLKDVDVLPSVDDESLAEGRCESSELMPTNPKQSKMENEYFTETEDGNESLNDEDGKVRNIVGCENMRPESVPLVTEGNYEQCTSVDNPNSYSSDLEQLVKDQGGQDSPLPGDKGIDEHMVRKKIDDHHLVVKRHGVQHEVLQMDKGNFCDSINIVKEDADVYVHPLSNDKWNNSGIKMPILAKNEHLISDSTENEISRCVMKTKCEQNLKSDVEIFALYSCCNISMDRYIETRATGKYTSVELAIAENRCLSDPQEYFHQTEVAEKICHKDLTVGKVGDSSSYSPSSNIRSSTDILGNTSLTEIGETSCSFSKRSSEDGSRIEENQNSLAIPSSSVEIAEVSQRPTERLSTLCEEELVLGRTHQDKNPQQAGDSDDAASSDFPGISKSTERFREMFMKSVLHPRVIGVLAEVLKEKYHQYH